MILKQFYHHALKCAQCPCMTPFCPATLSLPATCCMCDCSVWGAQNPQSAAAAGRRTGARPPAHARGPRPVYDAAHGSIRGGGGERAREKIRSRRKKSAFSDPSLIPAPDPVRCARHVPTIIIAKKNWDSILVTYHRQVTSTTATTEEETVVRIKGASCFRDKCAGRFKSEEKAGNPFLARHRARVDADRTAEMALLDNPSMYSNMMSSPYTALLHHHHQQQQQQAAYLSFI